MFKDISLLLLVLLKKKNINLSDLIKYLSIGKEKILSLLCYCSAHNYAYTIIDLRLESVSVIWIDIDLLLDDILENSEDIG